MAASMVHAKLSKSERKVYKKQMKSRQILLKHDGILTSDTPTKILCINNAGLGNGVTQEEVRDVCSKYGSVSEVIMLPNKPYCFVCFMDMLNCETAYNHVNGFLFRKGHDSSQDVYFYASFVSQVPAYVAPSSEMPPGLILLKDFITTVCEEKLLKEIRWETGPSDTERTLKHRKVKHYGYEFKYGINNVDPNEPLPESIPQQCKEFLNRAMEMGVVKHFPDQLTVNQYESGQGIPPHVDTPSAFEDGIMSLSLGSQVVMDFRHPDGRHLSVFLPPRSLIVMTGESRYVWSHGITPRKSDIITNDGGLTLINRGTRTSFTFRKLTPLAGINTDSVNRQVKDSPSLPESEEAALKLEEQHVHQVYEDIAEHFSGTRHKAWPQIAEFVQSQPTGTLLADIGCGNGKYLGINANIYELGSDRSVNLASICQARNFPVFVGDILAIPLRSDAFDVCLCIAVIHHLSTPARRCKAVSELLRVLKPGGQLLIYVWAMEQEREKTKSKYLKKKIHGTEGGDNSTDSSSVTSSTDSTKEESFHVLSGRRNHDMVSVKEDNVGMASSEITRQSSSPGSNCESGTMCADSEQPHGKVSDICKDTSTLSLNAECNINSKSAHPDKKLSVHVNRTSFKEQDLLVPWQLKNQKAQSESVESNSSAGRNTFHRFYHVFTEGELEQLCGIVGGSRLIKSYYDQGNWCVVLEKL